jgi:hypothetical protein
MAFELVTNATVSETSYPSSADISVRFLFTNGSASENPLTAYPLFGQSETTLPWVTFTQEMDKFAIGDQKTWCQRCGNTTGVCATVDPTASSSSSSTTSSTGGGMSRVVAGVIGAMVTLAVVLGIEALVVLIAGLRLVRKGRGSAVSVVGESAGGKTA